MSHNSTAYKSTFQKIISIFEDITGIDMSSAKPENLIFEDLGVDSLDFLDVTFEIDRTFSTQLPIEEWSSEVENNPDKANEYFSLANLTSFVIEKGQASQ